MLVFILLIKIMVHLNAKLKCFSGDAFCDAQHAKRY